VCVCVCVVNTEELVFDDNTSKILSSVIRCPLSFQNVLMIQQNEPIPTAVHGYISQNVTPLVVARRSEAPTSHIISMKCVVQSIVTVYNITHNAPPESKTCNPDRRKR
jgi:hypothetical protein